MSERLDLQSHLEQIVSDWTAATSRPPWTELSPESRADHLPDLVAALARVAAPLAARAEDQRELLKAAVIHGQRRRDERFSADRILDEYFILRDAIWKAMQTTPGELTSSAIVRVDSAITAATLATLKGLAMTDGTSVGDVVESIARYLR